MTSFLSLATADQPSEGIGFDKSRPRPILTRLPLPPFQSKTRQKSTEFAIWKIPQRGDNQGPRATKTDKQVAKANVITATAPKKGDRKCTRMNADFFVVFQKCLTEWRRIGNATPSLLYFGHKTLLRLISSSFCATQHDRLAIRVHPRASAVP
ncbi:MAG: hypothetical protein ABFC77_04835 [Thermoguttaceae bacterium]